MHPALARFADHLGRRCYGSDNKRADALMPRSRALTKGYVGLNRRRVAYLVADVDRQGAALTWEVADLPPPTLMMITPATARAHLAWELRTPVSDTDLSRAAPLRFLADVEARMVEALGADPAYGGLMVKNPLSPAWRVATNDIRYDLGELLEYLPDRKPRRPVQARGWGRNVDTFDHLRTWAYSRVQAARGTSLEAWVSACVRQAEALAAACQPPLPISEAAAIGKSVARWTWRHYTGSATAGRIEAAARALEAETGISLRELLVLMPGAVAQRAGVHHDTVLEYRKTVQ